MKLTKTEEELISYFRELAEEVNQTEDRGHAYEIVAENAAKVALAAFNYWAKEQGMTGFQAGWAAMRFVQDAKSIEGPFAIIAADKWLYPQYDGHAKKAVQELWEGSQEWLKEQAEEKLDNLPPSVHPDVLKHWMMLAGKL